jgi:hypothetical protein
MLAGWAEMTKTKPSAGSKADYGPSGGMFDSSVKGSPERGHKGQIGQKDLEKEQQTATDSRV